MNKENIQKVIDVIEANPASWDQSDWHCGTKHCFAGHAQILSGKEADDFTTERDACTFFNMSFVQADYYFDPTRTLEELKNALTEEWVDCRLIIRR